MAGWFSFAWYGATAGDLLAAEVVETWLDEAGIPHDRAVAPTLGEGVDALTVDPSGYTHLVFVCGPFGRGEPATTLLDRFAGARRIGVDLTMLQPTATWQPFDLLLERDSDRIARPDLALLAEVDPVPVVALVLVHEQKEHPGGRHAEVHAVLREALTASPVAVIEVDTCFDPPNNGGLRTPEQVVAVLSRTDVVVTTRLHGLVLGLRAGVPVLCVDPVEGGAKVARQAAALEWPVLVPDEVTVYSVLNALEVCLAPGATSLARAAASAAAERLAPVRTVFLAEVGG